ncbi:MAG: dicarboxylate/amino acid:cation symporter [Flavobacteriales bacterium]|nr:dicarboxylate/amino acid:cation symporter [Flavobacteriales bacterium]
MKLALHWKILIGMLLGLIFGFFAKEFELNSFIVEWIKPLGTVFINLLKMIAVPLIVASLICGMSELKDISKLKQLGSKTIMMYLLTTFIAVCTGLIVANIIQPGSFINTDSRELLLESFSNDANSKIELAITQKEQGIMQTLVDIVPDNFFFAMSNNSNMLQVIFFVLLFGLGMILIDKKKSKPVIKFFYGVNEIILKIIDLIMLFAPIGVFALMSSLIAEIPDFSILQALLIYGFTVVLGLSFLIFILYPSLLFVFTKQKTISFYRKILPAQLLAFSTSSSAATLPVTMECVIEKLKVKREVADFVLPIGATINMDGTSLYQAVAALFIAQVFGIDLSFSQQLMIVLTATLASIGSAAVPSAGMVMLVIVLGQAGIPEAGLALIFAIDRPLDMFRTMANVTSDATVATIVAKMSEKKKSFH